MWRFCPHDRHGARDKYEVCRPPPPGDLIKTHHYTIRLTHHINHPHLFVLGLKFGTKSLSRFYIGKMMLGQWTCSAFMKLCWKDVCLTRTLHSSKSPPPQGDRALSDQAQGRQGRPPRRVKNSPFLPPCCCCLNSHILSIYLTFYSTLEFGGRQRGRGWEDICWVI